MNFIKEALLTFTRKDKDEFEYFLARKNPTKPRKDGAVFRQLYEEYKGISTVEPRQYSGQNYHAIRKRLSKELVSYLVLKKTSLDKNVIDREGFLIMVKYFMEMEKHQVAWELLVKEERQAEKMNNISLNLKIQSMKLEIMPYYKGEHFDITKNKMLDLQLKQAKRNEFQLYFIQMQNELKSKMEEGDLSSPKEILENVLKQYTKIREDDLEPVTHLKIIEIIRSEYLIQRKYTAFSKVAQEYYDKILVTIQESKEHWPILAQLEYIMAHAYFRVRNFDVSAIHLQRLCRFMMENEYVNSNFKSKYVSLKSSINVFKGNLDEAITAHNELLNDSKSGLSLKEVLNLTLNLVAYYCTAGLFSEANKLMVYMNESDNYYQKHMGREWLIRKELIRALLQLELGNMEISIGILSSVKKKHRSMLVVEKYDVVLYYINAVIAYLKDPLQVTVKSMEKLENQIKFRKEKLFEDPKMLAFYAWFKSKIVKKKLYQVLLQEYNLRD